MGSYTTKPSSAPRRGSSSADTDLTRPPRDDELALPFERDESPDPPEVADAPRQVIEQAARDIKRGLRDTERRGLPSDVPGPGTKPEDTQGAAVPENGIDPEYPGRGPGPGSGGVSD